MIFVQSGSNKLVADAPPSPNATSRRIIHVGFIVRDAAKEDAFWRDILGFHPYWHGGRNGAHGLAKRPGAGWRGLAGIHVEFAPDAHPEAGRGDGPLLPWRGAHGGCDCPARRKTSVRGPTAPRRQVGRDGKVQLNLYDPDLTRVEFMEFRPAENLAALPLPASNRVLKKSNS